MNIPFEQIQQALGAAIRGEEMHPVVSQKTLFGIPSSVEVQMAKFSAQIAQEQAEARKKAKEEAAEEIASPDEAPAKECAKGDQGQTPARIEGDDHQEDEDGGTSFEGEAENESPNDPIDPTSLLRARIMQAALELGGNAVIGRGMRYFVIAGRNAGFDIPAYPFDPKGEFREFLKDSKVKNLPEWYETIGVPKEKYEQLQTHALLVITDPASGKKASHLLKGAEYCNASKFVPLAQSGIIALGDRKCLESIAKSLEVDIDDIEND